MTDLRDKIKRAKQLDQSLPSNWKTESDIGARWNIIAEDGTDICIVHQQVSPTRGPDLRRTWLTACIVEMRNTYGMLANELEKALVELDRLKKKNEKPPRKKTIPSQCPKHPKCVLVKRHWGSCMDWRNNTLILTKGGE